ncbi:MAG: N-acetyltransferase, partial [Actinomycetota bacterium]
LRSDRAQSRAVQVAAFGQDAAGREPDEAPLLDALRSCDGWLPTLSLVAEVDGQIVGHNVCTRGHVGDRPCVGLGPIGVLPDRQGQGIGSALMWAMIGAADATGEPLIALLGDPGYYARFGFVAAMELGVAAPDPAWGAYFQALPLTNWAPELTGAFRYAAPFEEIGV